MINGYDFLFGMCIGIFAGAGWALTFILYLKW